MSLAVHAGAIALLAWTVHFVVPKPIGPADVMTAHLLMDEVQVAPAPDPLPPTPQPPKPAPPQPVVPSVPPAQITPTFEPDPVPAPIQPIITTKKSASTVAVASAARLRTSNAASSAPTTGAATGGVTSMAHPRYASNPPPSYPPDARRLKQQGVVLLHVKVGADGNAASVSIKQSSGIATLDEAALSAVRRWKFEPARVGGVAVSAEVDVPVRFQLK